MTTLCYIIERSLLVRRIFFSFALWIISGMAMGQLQPMLEDTDLKTPFGNCDHLPTLLKPDYLLIVKNISQNISPIKNYTIDWGDHSGIETVAADFVTAQHTYLKLGMFNLKITAYGTDGSEVSKIYPVSNQSNPSLGLSNNGGNTIGCSPLTLNFTISGANQNAPGTYYVIDFGDGSTQLVKTLEEIQSNNQISHTYVKSSCEALGGEGQFTLKVSAINSCTSTDQTINGIRVFKSPVADFSVPADVCFDATVPFSNKTVSGIGYNCSADDDYLWNFGDGSSTSSEKNPTHNFGMGTYLVSLTSFNDQCSSGTTKQYSVNVHGYPEPLIEGATEVCAASIGVVYKTKAGMKDYQWTVSSGGVIKSGAGTNSIVVNWGESDHQTVSVNYAEYGCSAPQPTVINVKVNPLPEANVGISKAICAGSGDAVSIGGAEVAGNSYFWVSTPAGFISDIASPTVAPVTSTKYTLTEKILSTGCTKSNSVEVVVNPLPVPLISGAAAVCPGSTGVPYHSTPGMSDYNWEIVGGVITSSPTAVSDGVEVSWNDPGNQKIKLTYVDKNGCSGSSSYPVAVGSSPSVSLNGPIEVCEDETGIVYTAVSGMSNYSWIYSTDGGTLVAGGDAVSNTAEILWETPGDYTVSVNYTLPGCQAVVPAVLSVKVKNRTSPTIDGLAILCSGSSDVSYRTESGYTNYTWVISSGGTITSGINSNEIFVNWSGSGDQFVTVNYDKPGLCSAAEPTRYDVKVNNLPEPSIAGLLRPCQGNTPVEYTTESGMNNYVWEISSGGTIVEGIGTNKISVLWEEAGEQKIGVNYENSNGCAAGKVKNVNVTVIAPPVATVVNETTEICSGVKTNILLTSSDGSVDYSWQVDPALNSVEGAENGSGSVIAQVLTQTGTAIGLVRYLITPTVEGCAGEVFATEVKVKNLSPVISGPEHICGKTSGVVYTTESGMSDYKWVVSSGGTITDGVGTGSITVDWNGTGNQTVGVTYNNLSACEGSSLGSNKNITIGEEYVAGYAVALKKCSPFEVHFQNAFAGAASYRWENQDGKLLSTECSPTLTFDAVNGVETNYMVKLIATSSDGCTDVINNQVTVFPIPQAAFSPSVNQGCSPLNVTFANQSSDGASTYQWDFGDGGETVTLKDPDYTFLSDSGVEKLYNVSLLARNAYGCVDLAQTEIKVYPTPQPLFIVDPENSNLPEKTVKVINQTTDGPWNYTWSWGDNSLSQNGDITEHIYSMSGYYTISLTASGEMCASTKKVGVSIGDGAPVSLFECEKTGCAPLSVLFHNASSNGFKFFWDFGNGSHSTDFEPKMTYYEGGTYIVRLDVYNILGEVSSSTQEIIVNAKPTAFFKASVDRVKVPGDGVRFINLSEDVDQLLWDFGDGTTSNEYEPVHYYSATGIFNISLKVSTLQNCQDEFVLSPGIEAYGDQIRVANAFVPSKSGPSGGVYVSGDPRNRIFYPNLVSGDVIEYQFQIFNRWGNLFFQSNEVERGWDGYYNGKLCPQDVYIWKLKCRFSNQEVVIKTGDVTLIQ